MEIKQKKCPACATVMREIKATSTYGSLVLIDQCDGCGGLWFDDLEVYQVKTGEAGVIDGVDVEKLRTNSVFAEGNFHCPNDGTVLSQFKDPFFPTSLHIDNCQKCGGFWLNRGEFKQFQEERKAYVEKNSPRTQSLSKEDKIFDRQIQSLFAANSDAGISDSVGNFATFLSTPIDPMTNRPLHMGSSTGQANAAIDIAFGILNIVFRLFLR